MDFTQIVRNVLTNELYKDNETIFSTNMNFFYELEDSLYLNQELNRFIKSAIVSLGPNLFKIYNSSISDESDIIFKTELDNRIDQYLKLSDLTEKNLEHIIVPIHRIFYRLFIKGGAALKVFVDSLETVGILDIDHDVPSIANSPTDIDTNLVVNPFFFRAFELNELLKSIIEHISLTLMNKYKQVYIESDDTFYKKLITNTEIVSEIAPFFQTKNRVALRLPSVEYESRNVLPQGGFSIKPEGSQVRISRINSGFLKIVTFRLLLCIDVIDLKYETEKVGEYETGKPDEELLLASEAELIDITIYNTDNPKIYEIWNWGKNAMSYGDRYTLYQGIHDMILDLILMIQNQSGHPSLASKSEKRKQRLEYLYYLYCNYRLIQHILENNNKMNRHHIKEYCKDKIETSFKNIGLSDEEIETILPYIIGQNPENIVDIVYNFILNYVYKNEIIQYNLDIRRDGLISSQKLYLTDVSRFVSENSLYKIHNYLQTVFSLLDSKKKCEIFARLVSIYNENQNFGNTTLLLYTAILKACFGNSENLAGRINEYYTFMRRQSMNVYDGLFITKTLTTLYRERNIQNISAALLNENIGKMCRFLLTKFISDVRTELAILNKYPPYQVVVSILNGQNFLFLYEKIVRILFDYFMTTGVEFYIVYEFSGNYPIYIYYRVPFRQTIDGISINGQTDIMFAKLFFNEIKSRDKMIRLLIFKNKSVYYLNSQ
jgi:hypothetical protein